MVCAKLGVKAACTTQDTPLLSYRQYYSLAVKNTATEATK
jgi:hypothetical protein